MARVPLRDLVNVMRSKNAGPFEITLDLVFKQQGTLEQVVEYDLINRELIATLYQVARPDLIKITPFPALQALKVSIPRSHVSGGFWDSDVYGAQQHVPLLHVILAMPD